MSGQDDRRRFWARWGVWVGVVRYRQGKGKKLILQLSELSFQMGDLGFQLGSLCESSFLCWYISPFCTAPDDLSDFGALVSFAVQGILDALVFSIRPSDILDCAGGDGGFTSYCIRRLFDDVFSDSFVVQPRMG